MERRLITLSMVIVALTLLGVGIADAGRLKVSAKGSNGIKVVAEVPSEGWVGCSYWVGGKRTGLEPEYIVGEDAVYFDVPSHAKYTVALWKKKYDYEKGPEPKNPWAKANGYYLYGKLGRFTGRNK